MQPETVSVLWQRGRLAVVLTKDALVGLHRAADTTYAGLWFLSLRWERRPAPLFVPGPWSPLTGRGPANPP